MRQFSNTSTYHPKARQHWVTLWDERQNKEHFAMGTTSHMHQGYCHKHAQIGHPLKTEILYILSLIILKSRFFEFDARKTAAILIKMCSYTFTRVFDRIRCNSSRKSQQNKTISQANHNAHEDETRENTCEQSLLRH